MGRNGTALQEARGYADDVIAKLDRIIEHTERESTTEQIIYQWGTAKADAAGVANLTFQPKVGALWWVQRVVVFGSGVAGSFMQFFLNEVTFPTLIDRIEIAGTGVGIGAGDSPSGRLYVPPAQKLLAQFGTQTPGQDCFAVLRVREIAEGE